MLLEPRLLLELKPAWRRLALVAGCGVAGGAAAVGQAWWTSQAIGRAFLDGESRADLWPTLCLLLGAILLRFAMNWAGPRVAAEMAAGIKQRLRRRLVSRALKAGPLALDETTSGPLTTVLVEGLEALDGYIADYLPQLLLAASLPPLMVLFVFFSDPLSGLVLLLTAPLIPIFMVLVGRRAEHLSSRRLEVMERLGAVFLEAIEGLTTLVLLGRSGDRLEQITTATREFRKQTVAVLRVAFLSAFTLELLSTLSIAVIAVEIGLRLLYGRMEFQAAFFVLLLAPEFYQPLRLLGTRYHAGLNGRAAAERVWELLDGLAEPAPAGSAAMPPRAGVFELKAVYYTYPAGARERRPPALRGLSLQLGPGSSLALVGPSGGGKSTAARILMRFLEPDRGGVLVDGRDAREIDPEQWRRSTAWVPQQPHLFHETLADNLRLARPEATDDQLWCALRWARSDAFAKSLPQGLDTPLGERGQRLSGGQAQRVALARAFLRDARLLVLDESTAHLDPRLQAEMDEALGKLLEGRTALIIAHRLSTARRADRIAVVDGGRVVEEGSHETLIAQGGLYRRLVQAQSGEVS